MGPIDVDELAFVYDRNCRRVYWGARHGEILKREGMRDLMRADSLVMGTASADNVQFVSEVTSAERNELGRFIAREFEKQSEQSRRWQRRDQRMAPYNDRQKLAIVSCSILVATAAAFVGAWQLADHHFLSDLMFALAGAGVAAVLSVILIERLLEWRREALWATVREQTLNALRRTLERLFLEIAKRAPPAFQDEHRHLRSILLGPPVPSTALRMGELADSMRQHPSRWDNGAYSSRALLTAIEPHVQRLSEVLLMRAVEAQAKPNLIARVGSVEREFDHWESYVQLAEDGLPDGAVWTYALPKFVDVTVNAYAAVTAEMLATGRSLEGVSIDWTILPVATAESGNRDARA